jgi:formamidopyrimidine-DNA glycosylase
MTQFVIHLVWLIGELFQKGPTPEAAEVKLMAEDLAKALGSARYQVDFNSISVLSGRYLKFPNTRPVLDYIHGQSRMVRRIYAKGKLLVIECADSAILINPSMTGTVSLAATKHSRLQLWFTVQAGDKGGNVWVHSMTLGTLARLK